MIQGNAKEDMINVFRLGIGREENDSALLPQSRQHIASAKYTIDIMAEAPTIVFVVNSLGKSIMEELTTEERGKRFVKGVFSKQSHSSPWKQHITGFPRGIFRKFHNLYLSANPSIYGYVISLPFIFAYSAKLLRAFAKPTISDSFNVQITDSHSLIHFFVRFICSSEI